MSFVSVEEYEGENVNSECETGGGNCEADISDGERSGTSDLERRFNAFKEETNAVNVNSNANLLSHICSKGMKLEITFFLCPLCGMDIIISE
jgi:hypothetical protein